MCIDRDNDGAKYWCCFATVFYGSARNQVEVRSISTIEMNFDLVMYLRTAAPLFGRCSFCTGLKLSLKYSKDNIFVLVFDTIEGILLEGGDVGITERTLIYHAIK